MEHWAAIRDQLTNTANHYSLNNLGLIRELIWHVDNLQTDKGDLALRLKHQTPVFYSRNTRDGLNVNVKVIACRNLKTLYSVVLEQNLHNILPFVTSIDPDIQVLMNNSHHAYLLYDHDFGPIIVHKTGNRPTQHAVNPVTVSFFVQSYKAAEKAQGLLLLIGEAKTRTKKFEILEYDTVVLCDAQEKIETREPQPDVELHLRDVQNWDAELPPLNTLKAWQTMANIFHKLEIHKVYQGDPVRSRKFRPAGPTMFGTLRVYLVD